MLRNKLVIGSVICLLFSLSVPGQNVNVDSLKNLLKSSKGKEKVEIFFNLATASISSDINQGIDYSLQAVQEAQNTKDNLLIGKAYHECGKIYNQKPDDQKALEVYLKALEYYEKGNFREETGYVLNNIAATHLFLNNIEQSITESEKAIRIGNELNNQRILGSAYYNLGNSYYNLNSFQKALDYHLQSLEAREKSGEKKDIAASLNRLGILAYNQGDFEQAVKYYQDVLEIRKEIDDKRGAAIVMLNLGNAFFQLGNYDNSIANYKDAYEYFRQLDHKTGIASTLNGMGMIYEAWNQYSSALEAYKEMLTIQEELGNAKEIANAYSNIGIVYTTMATDSLERLYGKQYKDSLSIKGFRSSIHYFDEAVNFNLQALKKRREINDIRGVGASLVNIGNTYSNAGDRIQARKYFEDWLSLAPEIQDDDQQSTVYMSLGQIYLDERKYETAIEYYNKAYELSARINKKSYLEQTTLKLAIAYESLGHYKRALEYFKESTEINKTVWTEESQKLIHEMQVKYETEAKENQNRLLLADQELKNAALKQKNNTIYFFIFITVAFIGFVIMLIRQNTQRKKANEELARKNELITEQKKEITDSIQYASRIQNAVLPPDSFIESLLPEYFIIYRPRDIVSGDYYWITKQDNKVYTMVADCTGHGVPGAFMSMLGISFLNEIVSKHTDIHANVVLNELRKQVIESLHQTGREGENQDGMDVAFYILDRTNNHLEYAGANNSLFIFRNSELIELEADNMPIGIHKNAGNPFNNHEFIVQTNDVIYAFSDGYADQFGGKSGKKFMIRNLKKLLQEIHGRSMREQKRILDKTLDDWMGDMNQVDDILVMGVKIT